ncbi:flagellar hook-associated protein FlgL [Aciduricibacillus chroicocephali]|uniref:Flagellar hook-associated protein FlgL n=1 Tax=Aciduricibacillus chroicocephali TaxID=3054939 RepID=A0ABY9KT95_9BACI|nr:flagellar hook-associated protein FlgL [Bacillaceae bacterium 44XB]
MRITQGMMTNNMLNNLTKSFNSMNKYMDQLNTGMKITKPSDDPFIAIKGLGYRSQLVQAEQYSSNAAEVHQWMDNSDGALDHATQGLQRLKELATLASNGTNSKDELENIAKEVDQIKEDLMSIANLKVNDKYIFNGTNTTVPPFGSDGQPSAGFADQKPVKVPISPGVELTANVNGQTVFGGDFFANIDNFSQALKSSDSANIDQYISKIDTNIESVVNARADLGARMNRLDLVENRLSQQELTAKDIMSKNENVDYEKAITDLLTQETMHRAALSAGARIMQPSLVDFLR